MTIPVAITLVVFFVLAYLSAVKNEQFDDLETPAHIPFSDDEFPTIEEQKTRRQ